MVRGVYAFGGPDRDLWPNSGPSVRPDLDKECRKLGGSAGYDDWQAGRDPADSSTQDNELAARFDPILGGRRVANYLRAMTLETQTLALIPGQDSSR
jgi:hypothetical protein